MPRDTATSEETTGNASVEACLSASVEAVPNFEDRGHSQGDGDSQEEADYETDTAAVADGSNTGNANGQDVDLTEESDPDTERCARQLRPDPPRSPKNPRPHRLW